MAKTIDPQRLKQLRQLRLLSQDELAKKAKLNKQTIYRLEREAERRPIRDSNLTRIVEALECDLKMLTGAAPIPSGVSRASAVPEDTAYQLNVRVDAPIRNAFELVARHYGVSVPQIARLAPLFFVILAEASLKHRRAHLDELKDDLDRISNAELLAMLSHAEEIIEAEHRSIDTRDLFGKHRHWLYGNGGASDNPFLDFLLRFTKVSDDITITAIGPTSTEYRVCRSEASHIARNDEELAGWLLGGEVPLHRIPRDLAYEDLVEWLRQNKISTPGMPEQAPDELPPELPIPSSDDIPV